ncbi:MAG: hypothetical protein FWF91_05065 [Coriobacteriia bacterium]|nr:hypothetical protein [Coriobacteriia bacterium]
MKYIDDIERLRGLGGIPVEFSSLRALYRDYSSPASKIALLSRQGLLTRLQKGLYLVSETITGEHPDTHLAANHLYGPSYISLESAMQEYGMIPEAVYSIESVTTKRSRDVSTQLGSFRYHHVPDSYYGIGLRMHRTKAGNNYLIASPEKALCDHFVTVKGLQVRSLKSMVEYLVDYMRIDTDSLTAMDLSIIKAASRVGSKQQTLHFLEEAIRCLN